MSANNARQTDAALPTTAYMSSPQTNEAGATRQPAESASLATLAISNGHSTTAESMDTYPGDPGVMVTTCPAPSPLPAISTFIDGQVRQSPETWIISLQRGKPESTSHTPREVRGTRHIILSATNARQTDTDLPTITDMWSPQRYEAGVTRQPAESSSRALSNDHSTTAESMDTNPGDPGVMVTTRLAPSPLPAISTFINEQARRWRESRIEASQSHELERTAYTPREVRETRHIIPSANDARQTDADLPTPADMPEDAPPPSPPRSNFIDEQTRQSPKTWIESLQKESALHIPREVRGTRHITPSATNTRQTYAALPTIADMWSPQTHEAGATLQPAESTSHPFYSHHSTAIEPMGTYTGNLRRRFASSSLALENMDVNLQRLEDIINESAWLAENELEPRIGDLYCPREAVLHGIRGLSLYTAFVKVQGGNAYGCKYESCRAYSVRHVEEAIRHQRFHHFNHSPYQCISAARNAWYVSVFHIPVRWLGTNHCTSYSRRRFPSQIDLDNHLQNCK